MILKDKKLTGQIIKKHRKNKKLTQEELAELIGISEKHLGQIERGVFQPNIINFFKIIQILSINLNEFGIFIKETSDNNIQELVETISSLDNNDIELCKSLINAVKKHSKINNLNN